MSTSFSSLSASSHEERAGGLFNVATAFAILETSFMIFYSVSKFVGQTAHSWDALFMFPAYVSNIGLISCIFSESNSIEGRSRLSQGLY